MRRTVPAVEEDGWPLSSAVGCVSAEAIRRILEKRRDGGQWSVVGGQWSVVGGQWSVVSGQWSVGQDPTRVPSDRRPTTDDRRSTTDDRRPTTDDRRPTTAPAPLLTTDHRPPTTHARYPTRADSSQPGGAARGARLPGARLHRVPELEVRAERSAGASVGAAQIWREAGRPHAAPGGGAECDPRNDRSGGYRGSGGFRD